MTEKNELNILKNIISGQEKEISELKDENIRLKNSEEQYRHLFDNTPAAITLATVNGKLLTANRTMTKITGYTIEELKNLNMQDLYENPGDRKTIIDMLKKEGSLINTPMRLKRRNGSIYNALLTLSRIHQEGKDDLLQCICLDISEIDKIETEKKILQERLEQSRKLDSMAVLAGGVAHQFNNALAAIVGNIELLEMTAKPITEYTKYIKPVKETAYRMADLTDQLLDYASGTDFKPKNISIIDFLKDTLPLLKQTIKSGITIHTDIPEKIPLIEGDLSKLQMVLSALLSNSSEAIEETGNIWISCREITLTTLEIKKIPDIEPGRYIEFSIRDDGKGMDKKTSSRIFEPFFTTKFYGNGLGMSAVYGIIKKHEGAIIVESAVNKGTCIKVYFRPVEKSLDFEEPNSKRLSKGTGNVLLVEDEPIVMEVNQAILEKLGFTVLKAKTGREAIDIAESFNGEIALTLLDVLLPDMDGITVYAQLAAKRPGIRVIVCSGYSSEGPAQMIVDAGARGFIQKPFSFKVLSEKIREALNN
jgi:two-component system, cell cycle sensor histidine kinase and response regulator CckA